MSSHLLIEWRNSSDSEGIRASFAQAASLAREGHRVTVALMRDAVKGAARSENLFWFSELERLGVEVIADLASLRAHDISTARLCRWVRPIVVSSPLDTLVDEKRTDLTRDGRLLRAG